MKHTLFLLGFILSISSSFGQAGKNNRAPNLKPVIFADSAVVKKVERLKDSITHSPASRDSSIIRDDGSRNIKGIIELQKEQDARKKRGAIIRIAIGLGLLVLLVFGLSRRKKIK